jgi:arsenate reductase
MDLEELTMEQLQVVRTVTARLSDEFAGTFGPETIERFISDSWDRLDQGRVKAFLPVLTERFARERLRALASVEGRGDGKPAVLFLCVHNAGRSQMAAGWMRHLAGDAVTVYTGGSEPASSINPQAVAAMAAVGVDIAAEFPKPWTDEVVRAADVVVTMGCGDACPLYPGTRYVDWELDDPAGLTADQIAPIRDEIRQRVEGLLAELTTSASAG